MMTTLIPDGSTLAELRAENDELMRRQPDAAITTDEIDSFLEKVASAGQMLTNSRERRAAQAMLNFWAAERIARAPNDAQWAPARLAEPSSTPDTADAAQAGSSTRSAAADAEALYRARQFVQIGATARRWKESGYDQGWLLGGDALAEAAQFAAEDPDIQMLVLASLAYDSQKRKRNGWVLAIVLILTGLLVALSYFYSELAKSEEQLSAGNETLKLRKAVSDLQATRNAELARLLNEVEQQQRQYNEQLQQLLDQSEAAARSAAVAVKTAVARGRATEDEIPPALKSYIDDLTPVRLPALPIEATLVAGYDPTFLQGAARGGTAENRPTTLVVPLPRLSGELRVPALPYVNFSIAMAGDRRMALFAAANIRRSGLVALRRPSALLQVDDRIPTQSQPAERWFSDNDLDHGHLVSAPDIAWGPAFPLDAEQAGRLAYGMTAVLTNATPQYDTFNRGVWTRAGQYARSEFAPQADRVTVFSGPVLAQNDRQHADGARVPRAFWKLLVAADPSDPTVLIVEAYVIAQVGRDGAKVSPQVVFDRTAMRVTVAHLERLTGLDFGEAVRAADLPFRIASESPPATADIATTVAQLDTVKGPDAAARRATMQRLLDVIRDPRVTDDDRARLVAPIVAMMRDASFKALSPEARVNAATLLAAVPKKFWDQDGRIDLKATARRAVGDAATSLGGCSDGRGDACAQLANAKLRLDWAVADRRTVYVQFAGMAREDVKALSTKLEMLGWNLPGEERTLKAANYNEVRYADGPGEKWAADLLAADYKALGHVIRKVIYDDHAKLGFTEVWISN